ncbi:hypothetical protein H6G06_15030 [Anabaena sphaerica FACHB-251]|uniref:Uncharacterized protein n=1 Tax=Anabaena sphaerica FACHB-251 TaxID=2692883 RepID=A0A926WIJ7_9NOST|nr:hypothetical protein [Anabaena sphaerica]MBD2294760.1 hypothetical protein [Anabaena sphaerica FACHB-251]
MFSSEKINQGIEDITSGIWKTLYTGLAKLSFKANNHADVIVVDKNGNVVLLVKIKAVSIQIEDIKQQFISQLELEDLHIPIPNILSMPPQRKKIFCFIMLVNLVNVEVIKFYNDNSMESVILLNTENILKYYDPEFSHKKILNLYLKTLIEAWLRDLAYHWKLDTPPASQELDEIGLLSKIEGGDTYSHNDY